MSNWLHSGRRRDLCAILYAAGEVRRQSAKNRLETHYDARIDSGSFYSTLTALEDRGLIEHRAEGLADVYSLTAAGERQLVAHFTWLSDKIDDGGDRRKASPDTNTSCDDTRNGGSGDAGQP